MKKGTWIWVIVLPAVLAVSPSLAVGKQRPRKAARPAKRAPSVTEELLRQPAAPDPFAGAGAARPTGEIDRLVLGRLKELGIPAADLCSDAVFVRRVYLDTIGTLPTAAQARAFLEDRDPNKRAFLIDRLLARDEFADYWTMKWSDLLRVKSEFPINLWPNAVQAYHRWIRTAIKENMPYDRFVRELLTASGSNFRVPQVNFYRAVQSRTPQALAQAVALTFMGVRPESWPPAKWDQMAAFFSQITYKSTLEWKEEIVLFDPNHAAAEPPPAGKVSLAGAGRTPKRESDAPGDPVPHDLSGPAVLPDGTEVWLLPDRDPREVFADWLINGKDPWFARTIVNRLWFWLLGRGIIEEPDDIRPDNPPSNPALLAYLERELIASHYDLRHMYRLILNSQIYQLSSVPPTRGTDTVSASRAGIQDHGQTGDPNDDLSPLGAHTRAVADANFAFYPLRRLEAEVLIDALCQITGTTEQYSSPIPEPFTFIPEDQRSIALADASITSSFLETFGRSPRDTGLESERNNRPTAAQRLHLLNSSHIQRKIEQSANLRFILQNKGSLREAVDELYLTVLSRWPTTAELETIGAYFQTAGGNRRTAAVDLIWALVNSAEFCYRH
jgi:hypothetical protein